MAGGQRNNEGHFYDILLVVDPVKTPDYFRYMVLDLSGSIAYRRHATINLKLAIRSFSREKETTATLMGGAPEPIPWDSPSRQNWSGGLVRTREPNLDRLKIAMVKPRPMVVPQD